MPYYDFPGIIGSNLYKKVTALLKPAVSDIRKKYIIRLVCRCVILLCAAFSACAETLMGGWQLVSQEEGKLPEDAQAAFDKAQEKLVGASYKPVALLATQVVAGTNYCILCEIAPVVPNPVSHFALVYIYADLKGNAAITNVADLDIAGLSQGPVE